MKTLLVSLLTTLAACAPVDATARRAPLATLEGYVHDGVFELVVRGGDGRVVQAATNSPLPTTASGPTGTTTPPLDTVLVHQRLARSLDAACNAGIYGETGVPNPFHGVCVPIEMISGYDTEFVVNAYVQLTSLTPCGATSSVTVPNSDPSNPIIGVDATYGLWFYASLMRPAGDPFMRDRAERNWYFQTSNAGASACFRFVAVAMGEPVTI